MRNNIKILREHEAEGGYDLDKALKAKSCKMFNKHFTNPNNERGISCKDYYHKHSSFHSIDKIETPTLFIHSYDDPICLNEQIPFEQI